MSTTVLESLQKCQCNLTTLGQMGLKSNPIFAIALEQLENAIEALENGREADFVIQDSLMSDIKK